MRPPTGCWRAHRGETCVQVKCAPTAVAVALVAAVAASSMRGRATLYLGADLFASGAVAQSTVLPAPHAGPPSTFWQPNLRA